MCFHIYEIVYIFQCNVEPYQSIPIQISQSLNLSYYVKSASVLSICNVNLTSLYRYQNSNIQGSSLFLLFLYLSLLISLHCHYHHCYSYFDYYHHHHHPPLFSPPHHHHHLPHHRYHYHQHHHHHRIQITYLHHFNRLRFLYRIKKCVKAAK